MFDGGSVLLTGKFMTGRNGQELLSTWVPAELAAAFKAQARATDGGAAGALRRMVARDLGRELPGPHGVGRGKQVSVRLKDAERQALAEAADLQGTTPANWLRSLAIVHLGRRPQWNAAELEALRNLFRELRAISNDVNQIARDLKVAAQIGEGASDQGVAVQAATELVRAEMRRVVAVMTGNFDYWGLPDADRPTAAPGAVERADTAAGQAEEVRKRRPRRRPARFGDNTD